MSESSLAAADLALLDEDEGLGQLDQVGDEITFVQAIIPDSFEHVDFTFFCGSETLTQKYWREALRAGSTVLDLSGALDQETGVLVRSPWIGAQEVTADLFTPAVVPAHPAALALGIADGAAAAGCAGSAGSCDGAIAGERVRPRGNGRTCISRP